MYLKMMVNKCIAPGCKAGYDSSDNKTVISTFRFPADESRRKIWTSRVPRLNWTPSNNSVLCEKHFEESCYKTERNDIKNDRRKQRKCELQRKELKEKIRLRSLVKLGFNMSSIKDIFNESNQAKVAEIAFCTSRLLDEITDYKFEDTMQDPPSDQAIVFYTAGYSGRSIMKNVKCVIVVDLL